MKCQRIFKMAKDWTQFILSLILLVSCSQNSSQMNDPLVSNNKEPNSQTQSVEAENNIKLINDYILTLSDWSHVVPEKNNNESFIKSKTSNGTMKNEKNKSIPTICQTAEYDLTKTPEKIIMNNPAAGILYPGALIQGEGYLQGPGGLKELPIRKRAPLQVVIDLSNEKNSSLITDVNYAGFQKAYAEIIKNIKLNQTEIPAIVSFNQSSGEKLEATALKFGLSLKYLMADGQLDAQSKNETDEKTYTAIFEQRAFSLSAVSPLSPGHFFNDQFTLQDLKQQEELGNINNKNLPLYVSSVTYGRMLLISIRSTAQEQDIKAALKASYNQAGLKIKGDLAVKYKKVLNDAQVQVIAIGGDTKNAENLIKNLDLNSYFSEKTNIESFVPISYVIRSLKDNSIAKMSETLRYSTKKCEPVSAKAFNVRITIEKIFMKYTGARSKGEIFGELSLNGQKIWSRSREQYVPTSNNSNLDTQVLQKPMDFLLPVNLCSPVMLSAKFIDNDSPLTDEKIAEFNEPIGYDTNSRVLESGVYQTDSQTNVTITYKLEKLDAIY